MSDRQYSTVAHWAFVRRMFEFSRRRENLSWAHHAEVARFKAPGHTIDERTRLGTVSA